MVRQHWFNTIMTEYNGNLPPIISIQQKILNIPDDLTRIFCILSYLTGGRISEICNYKQEKHIMQAKRNNKGQTIKDASGKTVYEKVTRPDNKIIMLQGLMKKNVTRELLQVKDVNGVEKEIDVVRIAMRNEKNKVEHFKIIHAPYYFEKELIDNLFVYLDNQDEDEVIVNVSRRSMYNHFIRYAKELYYPHFIRALRVGVLIEVYGFTIPNIQVLMGWSDMRPFKAYYIFKQDKEILNTFIKRIEENKKV